MQTVTHHLVTVDARPTGTDEPFQRKTFDLMLGEGSTYDKRLEAKRVLAQIGWDTLGVNVAAYVLV